MNIKLDAQIIEQYPAVKLGVLIGKNLHNAGNCDVITTLLPDVIHDVQQKYKVEDIASIPQVHDWRTAYKSFGCKPSKYHSSIESLLRRVLKNKQLPMINPLVDCYNYISLKYVLPAGGADLDAIDGDIHLALAQGNEKFMQLGQTDIELIAPGEVVYKDNSKVLCRAWNYRESEQSKITNKTKNAYLVLEGLAHTPHEQIKQALTELQQLAEQYCGGTFTQCILDKNSTECVMMK